VRAGAIFSPAELQIHRKFSLLSVLA